MDSDHSRRIRVIAVTLAGSALCVGAWFLAFDPLSLASDMINGIRARWELPRARERWVSLGLPSYRVHVTGAVPLACLIDGELTVRDGRLVDVRMRDNPLIPASPVLRVPHSDWDPPFCSYEDLLVDRMFERVQRSLDQAGLLPEPLVVRFDEDMGFVAEYRYGRATQGGIFGPSVTECCTWFRFDHLEPIEE